MPRRVPNLLVGFATEGPRHTCVVLLDNPVKCWGSNGSGQLGIGARDDNPHTKPEDVMLGDAKKIQAGSHVQCWGANNIGQLAGRSRPGPLAGRSLPTQASIRWW
jgi:hypothetical protein